MRTLSLVRAILRCERGVTIARNLPSLLANKLYSSISTLPAEFNAQNTKIKKENVRPDVTQINIAEKKSRRDIFILFSALYTQTNRLYNYNYTEHSNFCR